MCFFYVFSFDYLNENEYLCSLNADVTNHE